MYTYLLSLITNISFILILNFGICIKYEPDLNIRDIIKGSSCLLLSIDCIHHCIKLLKL